MAVPGFSGSDGGIGESYRRYLSADLEVSILKYEKLLETIPESQKEIKALYKTAIRDLQNLKEEMGNKLERILKE